MAHKNFVLVWEGNVPEYIKSVINQINKSQTNSTIYFICESDPKLKNVVFVDIKKIKLKEEENFDNFYQKDNFYKNFLKNKLLSSSINRFFYLKYLTNELKLSNIITFDCDVYLLENLENFFDLKFKKTQEMFITRSDENNVLSGFIIFKNFESVNFLCSEFLKIKNNQESRITTKNRSLEKKLYKEYLCDMTMMNEIQNNNLEKIILLPTLYTLYLNKKEKFLFDANGEIFYLFSAYKNFFNIDSLKNPHSGLLNPIESSVLNKKYLNFIEKNIKIKKNNKKFFINFQQEDIPVVTLHIRSKQINEFDS